MREAKFSRNSACRKGFGAILCSGVIAVMRLSATEEWSDNGLSIYGGTDTSVAYEKRMEDESLAADWLKVGTVKGSAVLAAKDSSIDVSEHVYLGWQDSNDVVDYTSSLILSNTILRCSTFSLGFMVLGDAGDMAGNERIQAEVGPGSIIAISDKMTRNCKPWSRVRFTGGRIVFSKTANNATESLCTLFGRNSDSTAYFNNGLTWEGVDAPIDIEVSRDSVLAEGHANRNFNLCGNGGFIKRGDGILKWGWRTSSGSGKLLGDASYTGDTVIKAGGIRLMEKSDTVRFSMPEYSALKMETGAFFDLAGNSADWVSVSGEGIVKNSSDAVVTLSLGKGDGDCMLEAKSAEGLINVVKTGEGILTVDVPEINGSLTVLNGGLRVRAGSSLTVDSIVAEPGVVLDFRGAEVHCGELSAPEGVVILKDGDTDLSYVLNVDADNRLLSGALPAKGVFTKTGEGTLTLVGSCEKTGEVNIAEGMVLCETAQAFKGKYFRLNYRRSAKEEQSGDKGSIQFSEFSLYGADGARINEGSYSYTPLEAAGTQLYGGYGGIDDARILSENEVAVWMPNHDSFFMYETAETSPVAVFDGNVNTKSRNQNYWNNGNKIVFRISDDAPDAVGYTFTTSDYPIRRPTEWTLEGSEDGASWVTLAEHKADESLSDSEKSEWRLNSTPDVAFTEYNNGFPYAFDNLSIGDSYAPFGTAVVSVSENAVLKMHPSMKLAGLRIDMNAGAGRISGGFTPMENGIIMLDGDDVKISRPTRLPLSVESVENAERLKTWRVCVAGSPVDCRLKWADNALVIYPKVALRIVVR